MATTVTEKAFDDVEQAAREDGVSAVYEAKSRLINECLQNEIGWGRYQYSLFILAGLGWAADNIWLQGVAIILPQIQRELLPPSGAGAHSRVEYATLSLYVGLILGASTWGILSDLIGRKPSFNITLFICGVFGVASGASDNFVTLCSLIGVMGFGVGGNLPVDGAVYLEGVSGKYQWTLTLLSAWWALGQLYASLIAWPLISNFSCSPTADTCLKADNMGWRYTLYVLGGTTLLMWIGRFFIFDLKESSKWLVGRGRDEEGLMVLEDIARRNGRLGKGEKLNLRLEDFRLVEERILGSSSIKEDGENRTKVFDWKTVLKGAFDNFSLSHITPLFQTTRLAINTSITIILWGLIGLAYPLFNGFITLYLSTKVPPSPDDLDPRRSTYITYRNYVIISIMGIPGSLIACWVVDMRRRGKKFSIGGRKWTMAISTLLTGIFLFLFTTSNTQSQVLAYSCVTSLTQNAMYGVLYAYTPEVFPAPHRGTGDALCSAFNRITGILAPIIKIVTTPRPGSGAAGPSPNSANTPTFIAATLFLVSSLGMVGLPIETAGKAAI